MENPTLPGPHPCPQALAAGQKCSLPFTLRRWKGQAPGALALPGAASQPQVPPRPATPDLVILPLCAPRLWEEAGWSLGVCEQAGVQSRCGSASPGQPRWQEEERRAQGARKVANVEGEGHRGVLSFASFFSFFHIFFKKKPPSCVIIFMGSAILAKICL